MLPIINEENTINENKIEIENDDKDFQGDNQIISNSPYQADIEFFKYITENSKKAYILLIVGIIISFLITVLGCALVSKSANLIGILLIIFGIISIISFGWAIFSVKIYAEKCEETLYNLWSSMNNKYDLKEIDNSWERTFFNLTIYFMMTILVIFLALSIACFNLKNVSQFKIRGNSQNSSNWKTLFGDHSYDTIYNNVSAIHESVGIVGLILSTLISFLLYNICTMLKGYRMWRTYIQFICIIFIQVGLIFICISIYIVKFEDVAKINKSIPLWLPKCILTIAVLSIILGILGYLAVWTENLNMLRFHIIVMSVFTFTMIVIAVGGSLVSGKFREYFSVKCNHILDLINQDYLTEYMGCSTKYTFTTPDLNGMKCPKERIVLNWEKNLNVPVHKHLVSYGCLNMECCFNAYSYMQSRFDMLAITGYVIFIIGSIQLSACFYMLSHLELTGDGDNAKTDDQNAQYIVLSVLGVWFLFVFVLIFMTPKALNSTPSIYVNVEKPSFVNTQVPSYFVTNSNITQIMKRHRNTEDQALGNKIFIKEDKSKCEDECLSLKFFYELKTNDGIFLINDKKLKPKISEKFGDGWILKFDGNAYELQSFTDIFTFVPNCPLLPSKIHIDITAQAFRDNNNTQTNMTQKNNTSYKTTSFLQLEPEEITQSDTNLLQSKYLQVKSVTNTLNTFNEKETNLPDTSNSSAVPAVNEIQTETYQVNQGLSGSVVDYSTLKEGEIYKIINKDITYSFVNEDRFQIVKGKIVKVEADNQNGRRNIPVPNAEISIYPSEFSKCGKILIKTDDSGNFSSDKFNIFSLNVPIEYAIEINKPGITSRKEFFNLGGLAMSQIIELGMIEVWEDKINENVTVSSVVLNSINFDPEDEVNVQLWSGYLPVMNQIYTKKNQSILITDNSTVKFISSYLTEANGIFKFQNLKSGIYSLVFDKANFFREIYHLNVIGNLTKPISNIPFTPFVEKGKIRLVLSWPDGPKNLDFYALFNVDNTVKCEVYFGKKECVGTNMNTDNFRAGKYGIETITINELGNYVYTFGVNKFVDVSNGVGLGDNPISDFSNPMSPLQPLSPVGNTTSAKYLSHVLGEKKSNILDSPIKNSRAKISVYIYGFKSAISSINIPMNDENEKTDNIYNYSPKNWWLAFCLDGKLGLSSLTYVNQLLIDKPDISFCENMYLPSPATSFVQITDLKKRYN